MRPNNVLVIGGGGREHAICWKLSQSSNVNNIFVLPGNAGISFVSKVKCCSVRLPGQTSDLQGYTELIEFCKENEIGLVAIGPEEHLEKGIVDALEKVQIHCFGPSQKAARLETSKAFAKSFLRNAGIPTARYETFTDSKSAVSYIRTCPFNAYVVKASGLAAGKGVTVASNVEEACEAVSECLDNNKFKEAGAEIVVEELLEGVEISALAFTDGTTVKLMPFSQDHKRLLDKDRGPMTGGMGAYAPVLISPEHAHIIEKDILQKSVQLMREAGTPYQGVLYAGIMITKDGPQVLEFNCRFGDPETQVLMRLLKSDLYDVMMHCASSTLHQCTVEWSANDVVCGVVLASGGYPDSYEKGYPIEGLDDVEKHERTAIVFHAATKLAENGLQNGSNETDGLAGGRKFLTSGGRVLCVTASGCDLNRAYRNAYCACARIHFEKCHYRCDIGSKSIRSNSASTYSSAGVDINEGSNLVNKIKQYCSSTTRPGCTGGIGGFGALFDLKAAGYQDAILVSGTDGVGTKLRVAQSMGKHDTIGQDLVAMCVNDILVQNAEPLFFLDYFACGKLNADQAAQVIRGIAVGCKNAGCALVGGETAEMPGFYDMAEYDLAGFAVGCVERKDSTFPRVENIKEGDVVLGLASTGIHSNGFSLVRKIIEDVAGLRYTDQCPWTDRVATIGDDLLTPTKIYVKSLLPVLRANLVNAAAHITGGGLLENIPRVLPPHLGVTLDASQWDVPGVFKWIAYTGDVEQEEMARTFNCGLGMVLVVPAENVPAVKHMLEKTYDNQPCERVYTIGRVVQISGDQKAVLIDGLDKIFVRRPIIPAPLKEKIRVAVLISGTGSNFKALLDHTLNSSSVCSIACVVSNKADAKGLEYAKQANIPCTIVSHVGKSREIFDAELDQYLTSQNAELICLAGFMRILTAKFTEKWQGRMLNIHPSILPAFKGSNAIKMAIDANVHVTGSTIHFVAAAVDSGAIIKQGAIEIKPGVDDEHSVAERLKSAVEHKIYPQALEDVARCKATLTNDGRCVRRN